MAAWSLPPDAATRFGSLFRWYLIACFAGTAARSHLSRVLAAALVDHASPWFRPMGWHFG